MNIKDLLEIIGESYVESIKEQLVFFGLQDSNIINDVFYTIDNNTVVINIPDYAIFIENGRRATLSVETRTVPRKKPIKINGQLSTTKKVFKYKGLPNLSAIRRWVIRKKIDSKSTVSVNSLTFLIARSIAKNGIRPKPFLQRATEAVGEEVASTFAIQFSDIIDDNIKRILDI